ncbi:MAG: cell envelope integrity protein TolA [gamma proteobacterium symbiont of Phacoides pectinatus]
MRDVIKRNPTAVVIAIAMHLVLIAIMLVGVDWLKSPERKRPGADVVQARVIDPERVQAEVRKLQQAEEAKQREADAEAQRLERLKAEQAAEQRRLDDLQKQRVAEEKRHKEAETRRIAEEKKRRESEARKVAEEKQRNAAEARKAAEEKQRKEAEARKMAEEKQRKAAEAKRAAEEKKRKAAEAKRAAEERARQARAAREAEMRAALEAEENAREVDRYRGLIRQYIERNWVRPAGIGEGLSCTLSVRLAPGGAVLDASVVRGSGNGAFDRSARAAVYKADPLPVPSGGLFESFRGIEIIFAPDR